MDHNSIIDRKNFKVYKHSEDYPNAFICDKLIAPCVSILNKKGYKTKASCSGHYKLEYYEYFDCDLKFLDEYSKDERIIIKRIKDNGFDYIEEVDCTHIYILFDGIYHFDKLPDNFKCEDFESRSCVDCKVDYYDKFNNKRMRSKVEKELEEKCEVLRNWASNLPELKERND